MYVCELVRRYACMCVNLCEDMYVCMCVSLCGDMHVCV